jgi:transposase
VIGNEKEKQDGIYVVVTTLNDKAENIFGTYKGRAGVEQRIKITKRDIKIRPMFLQKENRICAFIFICILALMLYSTIQLLCEKHNIQMTPTKILELLDVLCINRIYFDFSKPAAIVPSAVSSRIQKLLSTFEINLEEIIH